MGNFLVVVPPTGAEAEGERLFRAGLLAASRLKSQRPAQVLEALASRAAIFLRAHGQPPQIAQDSGGNWLLAIGTWFHRDGYASGDEARLVQRWLEVGAERLALELNGFFTIVIGDAAAKEVLAITDIVGSCHAYVRQGTGGTALSGSALVLAALEPFTLDAVACQELINTGVAYEDRTPYRQVRKLAPASVIRFAVGKAPIEKRYWKMSDLAPESLDARQAPAKLWEALVAAATTVARRFPNPVCDLTGGYDSRAIVAAFVSAGARFTTTVSGPAASADVVISQGLAKMLGLPHLHIQPGDLNFTDLPPAHAFTDGEYDIVEYANIAAVHAQLLEQFELSVNGSFGEVARGYWWELLAPSTGARQKVDALKLARLRYVAAPFDRALFRPELRVDLASHFAGIVERANTAIADWPNTTQMDHAYLYMRMQRWQGRIASSTNQRWPCLSPFIFRPVLEVMLQTKARLRARSLLIRAMLDRFVPRIAAYPLEHGYPAMPARWNNLHRFWPLVAETAGKVRKKLLGAPAPAASGPPLRVRLWGCPELKDLFAPETMRTAELMDPAALASFISRSREVAFPFGGQWNRLLTLEYTLRKLQEERRELAALAAGH